MTFIFQINSYLFSQNRLSVAILYDTNFTNDCCLQRCIDRREKNWYLNTCNVPKLSITFTIAKPQGSLGHIPLIKFLMDILINCSVTLKTLILFIFKIYDYNLKLPLKFTIAKGYKEVLDLHPE